MSNAQVLVAILALQFFPDSFFRYTAVTAQNMDKQQCGVGLKDAHLLIRKYLWQRKYTSACYIAAFFARRGLNQLVVSELGVEKEDGTDSLA